MIMRCSRLQRGGLGHVDMKGAEERGGSGLLASTLNRLGPSPSQLMLYHCREGARA